MMNQQDIFNKIGSILTEINEQYQFLAQNPQQLNDLEVELFLANTNFLLNHINIVKKLNGVKNEKPVQTGNHALLEEQNTIILPEVPQGFKRAEECFDPAELPEVIMAEEEEERVDIKPLQEVLDEEKIQEETAESLLNKDFFKPDQDDHTFEFVLGNHDVGDKFDYEEKPVDEIFDRPLSKEEEEILAQKKKIHKKEGQISEAANELSTTIDEDEIGPEPFLISKEDEVETAEPKVELPKQEAAAAEETSAPIAALKNVNFDEPIISPPVREQPIFTPEAIPVKPMAEPTVSKPVPTLNDLLAKTNEQNDVVKSPITDLKQAINLNEKLLFVKDLFGGYNMAYSEAIDIVNKMTSFESADGFLQHNYAVKNNWAGKQATVDQFYELLNRRFSK